MKEHRVEHQSVRNRSDLPGEPVVSLQLALEHGLTEEEYGRVLEILGRLPTYTELGIFSVMWSEHCSYKNSIAVLKLLPRSGGRLLVGAGEENAGLVDIGDGLAVAFKIESHNHPSAVEPYQGAATGVGGILRDIFTMGARPIAALNSLRFGSLDNPRTQYLLKGVVKGIGDYGNCFGVPTVGGEVYFDPSYQENPLVNAMAVGIVKKDQVARAIASGVGNPVLIVGSATGRDGIHGATFASEEISEASESKRPSVQVGDPFTEKLLLEATLEAIRSGYIVGIQDMGAAGLTCSSSEMSAKGDTGMRINLDRVPVRESGMTPYEILLSESQERMLLVVEKGREGDIRSIFEKWDLQSEVIGEVTDTKRIEMLWHGTTVASIPSETLVLGGGAPVYVREARKPEYLDAVRSFSSDSLGHPEDPKAAFLHLLRSPSIASKRWIYEQYDGMVRTNNLVSTKGDAAVVLVKQNNTALSMTTDCNARYVHLNPRRGGAIAVAEAARNVVCTGALPIAITNCLNFGNPYKPEVYWQFKEAVLGIADACVALETPVTGGNVSFYNESPSSSVYPTPVIGMVGIIEDLRHITSAEFKNEGDVIILLGKNGGHTGGSEYLARQFGIVGGDAPALDLDYEKSLQALTLDLIRRGLVQSAHDCSEGGLAVALAECCILDDRKRLGASITLDEKLIRSDFLYFGEEQSRILITTRNHHDAAEVVKSSRNFGTDAAIIGTVGGQSLTLGDWVSISLEELVEAYEGGLTEHVESGYQKTS